MFSVSLLASILLAGAPVKHAAAHPDVGPSPSPDACETCHAEATPAVASAWEEGRHGLLLVLCTALPALAGAQGSARVHLSVGLRPDSTRRTE